MFFFIRKHLLTILLSVLVISINPLFVASSKAESGASTIITVKSCYKSPALPESFCRIWQFKKSDTGFIVYNSENLKKPAAIMEKSKTDGVRTVSIAPFGSSTKYLSTDGLLLSEGQPVPYDFLNPESRTPSEIKLSRAASGIVFSEYFTKVCTEVSLEEAVKNGWITDNNKQFMVNDSKMYVYKIINKISGNIVLTQLWQDGGDFWLFESSESRSSTRIQSL